MIRLPACWHVILLALLIGGCQGSGGAGSIGQPAASGDPTIPRITLKLYSSTEDKRQIYLEVDRSGQLLFAGGTKAALRQATSVATLSDAQRRAVLDVIQKHNLMSAPSSIIKKPRRVLYQLDLRVGGQSKSLRAVDDDVPGVAELHDLLFGYQAEVRYNLSGVNSGR